MRNIFCGFLFVFAAFAGSEPVFGGGTISVSGTPKTGQKLTATSTGTFTGNFLWVSANAETAADWTKITSGIAGTPNELWEMFASRLTPVTKGVAGANNSELTLDTALAGKYVWVARIDSSGNYAASSPLGPVAATPLPAGSVFLGGITETGQILTATSNGTLTGNFVWTSANSKTAAESEWTPFTSGVGGTNNSKLTLGDALVGKYVRVSRGGVVSVAVGPIKATPVPRTVSISGTPEVRRKLTATASGNLSGNFVWITAASATATEWTEITNGVGGANNSELTIGTALSGRYIRARITGVVSVAVGPVTRPPLVEIGIKNGTKPKVGYTLTATSTPANGFTGKFMWESAPSAAGQWTPIVNGLTGTNNSNLILDNSLADQYIRVTRSHSELGIVVSDSVQIIPPQPGEIYIGGIPELGKTLTASSIDGNSPFTGNFVWEYGYVDFDADSEILFEAWFSIVGSDIGGINDRELTLNNNTYTGYYIRAKRTDSSGRDVVSDPIVGPVTVHRTVSIAINGSTGGTPEMGNILTATFTGTFTGNVVWEYADPATPTNRTTIRGTDLSRGTLELTHTVLVGKIIWATRDGVESDSVGPVKAGTVTINSINGSMVGSQLTAISSSSLTGIYTWEWANENSETAMWTEITSEGTFGGTYHNRLTPLLTLKNKYVRAIRSGVASSPVFVLAGTVNVIEPPVINIGATFTAVSTPPENFTGNFVWEWAADASAETWTEITDGTSGDVNHNSELTIGPVHIYLDNKYVRVSRDGVHSDARLVNLSGSNPPLRAGESDRTYADAGMATVE